MKTRTIEDYDKTLNFLVKAYFKDLLEPMSCAACAVGNIVAGYLGHRVVRDNDDYDMALFTWVGVPHYFVKAWRDQANGVNNNRWEEQQKYVPYSILEIRVIEDRFMHPLAYGFVDKDSNFAGLCAVAEYLGKLYGVSDSVKNFKSKVLELKEV